MQDWFFLNYFSEWITVTEHFEYLDRPVLARILPHVTSTQYATK
jgi:hypothetical protein